MKAAELYRTLRAALGPWFRSEGFKVAKRLQLGWLRPLASSAVEGSLLIWIQIHPHGWDQYSGGSFFFNVQTGGREETFGGPTRRLQEFLTDAELETMRELQNRVIPKTQMPPREFIQAMRDSVSKYSNDPESLIDAYLQDFKPVTRQYRQNQDVSLRYRDAEDVEMWAAFLLKLLPRVVAEARDGFAEGERR